MALLCNKQLIICVVTSDKHPITLCACVGCALHELLARVCVCVCVCVCAAAIDLCAEGKHDCEQICISSPGSFTCNCNAGYKLNDDKKTCTS